MYESKRVAVLIAAAGMGMRFGAGVPKPFVPVNGVPMLLKTALAFDQNEYIDDIYVITSEGCLALCFEMLPDKIKKLKQIVVGGNTRQQSVLNGIYAIERDNDDLDIGGVGMVLVHDAARPFLSGDVIDRVVSAVYETGAAVCAVPVIDTIVISTGKNLDGSLDRNSLCSVQTPQGFDLKLLSKAHKQALAEHYEATDDGTLVAKFGYDVRIVFGDPANIKVTTMSDLPTERRIGLGFDVHALETGRKLVLGGVNIEHEKGLVGHSDADVVTHALMDALLGALKLGDIGKLFPDTDETYRDISSMTLLGEVMSLIRSKSYEVVNADVVILAEKPKLAGYTDEIGHNLAVALGVLDGDVSIKATTTEGLGFAGREEGIGAQSIVMLRRRL